MDSYQPTLKTVHFPNGRTARLLEALPTISSSQITKWFDLASQRFSIAMHLGAIEMEPEYQEKMRVLLCNSVIKFAQDNQALVADGGTDAGVMQIMGDAYKATNSTFPLLGVTVKNSITYPGGPLPENGRWSLNDAHTHFVIVDADDFGAESQLLVGMARATGGAGLALVINGGGIVRNEIEMHARLGTPVIALKGTGRYADALANAIKTSELRAMFDEGSYLDVFDINRQSPEELYHLIRSILLR